MKDKTKAGLLKSRGVVKKIAAWTPLIGIISGLAAFTVCMAVGASKENNVIDEFKKTDMFTETYSAVYEDAHDKYENGEMNIYNFNETMEHINSDKYVYEVLENAGEEAEEYRAILKVGRNIEYCSIPGAAVALASPFLLLPWLGEKDLNARLSSSADVDFAKAKELKETGKALKKKKELDEEKEDDEEEALPNIEDDYYKE